MKGALKLAKRAPHMLGGKVGMATKSHDAQFDELNRRFEVVQKYADKLAKDSTTLRDAVKNMLLSGSAFADHFSNLFRPMGSEIEIERNHPNSSNTIVNLAHFQQFLDELRETLTPEIELIESRIMSPVHDFIQILKATHKNITKRDHKLIDYDRANNSFTKIRDKKEKSLKDEQHLFKLEQDFETAAADYEYFNNTMKEELPRLFEMSSRFITPLFYSFYYMQLNVFYLTLDKLQSFSDGRYDISAQAVASVEDTYVTQLNDAAERLDALTIRKPPMPTVKLLQQGRVSSGTPISPTSSLSKGGMAAGAPSKGGMGLNRSSSSATAQSPPAYTAGGAASAAADGKRPPPPPPMKPKPKAETAVQYVVALYDYNATAEGDLSFNAGDRIEVVERTTSAEDWWTGNLNGHQGVFPGNYVRDE
ncbi:hypothetical protein CBS101457_002469 [Exobasidium rhododendri]|nr:hypothetical protein CBS101457_002469 [Exobasidium rhododendri]